MKLCLSVISLLFATNMRYPKHLVALTTLLIVISASTPITIIPIKPSIVASELNIVYRHISNPIQIEYNNFSDRKTAVSTEGGELTEISKFKKNFGMVPAIDAKEVSVSIIKYKKNGDTKTITSQKFRIRDLPIPTIKLGGANTSEGPINKHILLAQNKLTAEAHQSFPYKLDFVITSYDLTIISGKNRLQYSLDSDKFPLNIRNEVRELDAGDVLLFQNIRYKVTNSVDGFEGNAEPFVIVINSGFIRFIFA